MQKVSNVFIIGGMSFPNPNASTHRAEGISELVYLSLQCKTIYFGFSNIPNKGFYHNNEYYANQYPKTLLEWIKFTFSCSYFISVLKNYSSDSLIIINSSCPYIPTKKLIRYCKKNGIAFILDVDEWFAKSHEKFPRNIVKNIDTFLRMKVLCKKYKNYIVSSSLLKMYCSGDNKNVCIFPAIVSNKISTLNFIQSIRNQKIIKLIFVGTIEKRNTKEDLHPIINAIQEFNIDSNIKFYLNIVGAEGKNEEYISYYGKLPYNSCVEQLLESDFSIIPRNNTRKNNAGFPTKLSESFLYGIPVISTKTSDIPEYIFNGKNGYLVDKNISELYLSLFKNIENDYLNNPKYFELLKKGVKELNLLKISHFSKDFLLFVNKVLLNK